MNDANPQRANNSDRSPATNIDHAALAWDAAIAERVTAPGTEPALPEHIAADLDAPDLRTAWLALSATLTSDFNTAGFQSDESKLLDAEPLLIAVQRRIQVRRRDRQVRRIVALAAALFVTAGVVAGWNALPRNQLAPNADAPLVTTTDDAASKQPKTENSVGADALVADSPSDNLPVTDNADSNWQDADPRDLDSSSDLAQDSTNTAADEPSDWDADEQSLAQFSLLVSNWESSQLAMDPVAADIDSDLQTLESELQTDLF